MEWKIPHILKKNKSRQQNYKMPFWSSRSPSSRVLPGVLQGVLPRVLILESYQESFYRSPSMSPSKNPTRSPSKSQNQRKSWSFNMWFHKYRRNQRKSWGLKMWFQKFGGLKEKAGGLKMWYPNEQRNQRKSWVSKCDFKRNEECGTHAATLLPKKKLEFQYVISKITKNQRKSLSFNKWFQK